MLSTLRQELQEMLATVPTLRRPALRRSEDANALFATDLPLLADAADFCRLAEKHGRCLRAIRMIRRTTRCFGHS